MSKKLRAWHKQIAQVRYLLLLVAAGVSLGVSVAFGQGGPTIPGCFTLVSDGDCGSDDFGAPQYCDENGEVVCHTFIRTASPRDKCASASRRGNDRCELVENGVCGWQREGTCIDGTCEYTDDVCYVMCNTHKMTGSACEDPDPTPG